MTPKMPQLDGTIFVDEAVITVNCLKERLGLSDSAYRSMLKDGLEDYKIQRGRKVFFTGEGVRDFFRSQVGCSK